jgi:HNH endonuclease
MTGDQKRTAVQATSRRYYLKHRDQIIAYKRRYQQDHSWVQRTNDSRRKAKKWGGEVGEVDEQAIYVRDQWVCQHCRKPVDKSLPWPDPLSKSLDHRLPLSLGDSHTEANVQLAHLICNARKGARIASPECLAS